MNKATKINYMEKVVSYEVALIIDKIGFNTWCPYGYKLGNKKLFKRKSYYDVKAIYEAPTLYVLQSWLRDNYDIFVSVKRISTGSDEWKFSYAIEYLPRDKRDVKRRCPEFMYSYTSQRWNDWEDALEEGLKEGLKLI